MSYRGIVLHHVDFVLAQTHAARVIIPLDELLDDHRQQPGLIVAPDQFVLRADDVDIAPAAAVRILEDARQAHVSRDRVPVQRVVQVPQTFTLYYAGHV